MEGKFDFACPLVIRAFLAGDLDRASLGLRGVDEVHAPGRQVPVLEGEFVRTCRERVERRGEFDLNESYCSWLIS